MEEDVHVLNSPVMTFELWFETDLESFIELSGLCLGGGGGVYVWEKPLHVPSQFYTLRTV